MRCLASHLHFTPTVKPRLTNSTTVKSLSLFLHSNFYISPSLPLPRIALSTLPSSSSSSSSSSAFFLSHFHATHHLHFNRDMSCNGCRVLRKGCSESCILRPCLQWIESSEAQGHATVFVAKFFGRAGLMSFISAVPESQRPSLFQSLLFEACGRTVNPVNGAVGLLWTGNWHICQAAVETVLRGGTLRPMNELLAGKSPNLTSDETSEAEVACTDMWTYPNSRFSNSRSRLSPKRKRSEESTKQPQLKDLDLRLRPIFVGKSIQRAGTPSMNSEESETTTCFESSGVGDNQYPEEGERKLLNLFV